MSRFVNRAFVVLLATWIVGGVSVRAQADDAVRRHFGVIIVHGHLDQTIVPDGLEGIVQPPMFDRDHNPFARWLEWAGSRVTAQSDTAPRPRTRTARTTPPWQYVPSDFKYTPKTDWTYHRNVGKYQPKRDWTYTPTNDWSYHPKRYRSWG